MGGDDYVVPRAIAVGAQRLGYNAVRYPSERGMGANFAIFNNFEKLLEPQMVVPVASRFSVPTRNFN